MIWFFLLILISVVALLFNFLRPRPIPKGLQKVPIEKGFPLIGILPLLTFPILEYYERLIKKHGPVFGMKMGLRTIFVLNDYRAIRNALIDNKDNFSGRWRLFQSLLGTQNAGIVSTDGDQTHIHRRFIIKVMHEFGMGTLRSLTNIQTECTALLECLEKCQGERIQVSDIIPTYMANIITKFLMNKTFSVGDPKLNLIKNILTEIARTKDIFQFLYFTLPILDRFPRVCDFLMSFTTRKDLFNKVHRILQQEIEEHRKTFDVKNEGEDLIDRFLMKQDQLKSSEESVKSFTDFQLVRHLLELFLAGYETTSTIFHWSLFFMSKYQEIQSKVHQEIIDSIGTERLPTNNDRKDLTYTTAVMDEILRLSSVLPLALIHRTTNDTEVNSYFIPKDSLVLINLYACHVDPNVWEKPREFYPEHFLSPKENGNIKYVPKDQLNPFGMGKRQCIGESLGRMQYFIFFVSILQRFQVSFADPVTESQFQEALRANEGIVRYPSINEFVFNRIQ